MNHINFMRNTQAVIAAQTAEKAVGTELFIFDPALAPLSFLVLWLASIAASHMLAVAKIPFRVHTILKRQLFLLRTRQKVQKDHRGAKHGFSAGTMLP